MLSSSAAGGKSFGAKLRDNGVKTKKCGAGLNCNMVGMLRRISQLLIVMALFAACSFAQVIEYEANGKKYQTLTRDGLTIIVTKMPNTVAGFGLIQVSAANGSTIYYTIRPEEFSYVKEAGTSTAISADDVVNLLLSHGSHSDVMKLVTSYEATLYGIPNMRSTNGYEQRRKAAYTTGISAKLEAAAIASAISLAQTRIPPGQSTDGAVFIPLGHEKALTGGHLVVHVEGRDFEFNPD